ncbi:MAG: hypothetical protein SAL07_07825 [Oscillatoria sp. PMC 1051.18]|nr:hypothetical protein [Oscillatoria sp. PMC 1050.18]MEC5029805.1 hypothetical protein [Oscillatoria sp. PMC 1051.18]
MITLLEKAINQVKMLPEAEQQRIALLIIDSLGTQSTEILSSKERQEKLSQVLLLPELESGEEVIFARDKDTGREIDL